MSPGFSELRSKGGFALDECVSALQKCIRRGLERDAIFWATELDQAGYSAYAWRRLEVICSEDVGLGWPQGPAVIGALRDSFERTRKHEKDRPPEKSNAMLFLVHATALLARAPKSRIIDNAANVMYAGDRAAMRMEIPDCALDGHTRRGRALGRSDSDPATYAASYLLENRAPVDDPYAKEAKALDLAPRASSRRRWLLGELHREYARLDAVHGDGRRWALELAGGEFGRLISSSRELNDAEAAWLLERLRAESTG